MATIFKRGGNSRRGGRYYIAYFDHLGKRQVRNRYAAELRLKKKRSSRTIQGYLTAIKSFTSWLAINHKIVRDPLVSVRKPNPQADRRRWRRMLLPDEWNWLRDATAAGPERGDMPANERVLLYAVAIQTGLRSSELRSLTRGQLFLDQQQPFITCEAGSTKDGNKARQYIQSDLARDLQVFLATQSPERPVFKMPHVTNVARMLRGDLQAARDEWLKQAKNNPAELAKREASDFLRPKNFEGEYLDFHSLRHTCGAWLAMAGAHPKAVQAIMRHSTIVLTMDTYGHLFPGQEAETISRLPKMMASTTNQKAAS